MYITNVEFESIDKIFYRSIVAAGTAEAGERGLGRGS